MVDPQGKVAEIVQDKERIQGVLPAEGVPAVVVEVTTNKAVPSSDKCDNTHQRRSANVSLGSNSIFNDCVNGLMANRLA